VRVRLPGRRGVWAPASGGEGEPGVDGAAGAEGAGRADGAGRINGAGGPSGLAADAGRRPAGKGRPTPKRRDAEKRRRAIATAPANRREAARRRRSSVRQERQAARRALVSGDEKNLPPRDAGPVKRLVRDIVDTRHNSAVVILLLIFLSLGLGSVKSAVTQELVWLIDLAVVVGLIVDNWLLVRRVKRIIRERFGERETRGVGGYAVMRALQFRRFRMPPPKVKRGDVV
jgi:hypothetical protein